VYRYQVKNREHSMHIGPVDAISLEEAREAAHDARRARLKRIDPLVARAKKRAEERKSITFKDAADEFFNWRSKKWSPKNSKQFQERIKTYAVPIIGPLPMSALDKAAVLSVLQQKHPNHGGKQLWDAIPKSADRLREWIASIWNWAKGNEYEVCA